MPLDRDDLGPGRGELGRLPARCSAEVENALAAESAVRAAELPGKRGKVLLKIGD